MTDAPTPSSELSAAPSLAVTLDGLSLANPTMTASGTCGYAGEYNDFVDLNRLGAFVTKSITRKMRPGNPAYRIVETRAGMMNAIGLANVGLQTFIDEKIPQLREMSLPIIANVAGHNIEEYVVAAGTIAQIDIIQAIELNVSCPNVNDGLVFGTDPASLKGLVAEVRAAMPSHVKLIVKLSPNAPDIVATARAAIEGGANILSLINTYNALAINVHTRRPRIANGTGGLSGPAIRPLGVYLTHRVYNEVARDANVPLIGMGGIQTWTDAAEYLLAGATGLGIGTSLFIDPATPVHICDGLQQWLTDQGCQSIQEVIGTLQMPKK